MDIQLFIVILVFSGAIILLSRRFYLQLKGKKKAGCEKCDIAEKHT